METVITIPASLPETDIRMYIDLPLGTVVANWRVEGDRSEYIGSGKVVERHIVEAYYNDSARKTRSVEYVVVRMDGVKGESN